MKTIIVLFLLLSVTLLSADVLNLINGDTLSGVITGYNKKNIYIQSDAHQKLLVGKEIVQSVQAQAEKQTALNNNLTKYPTDHLKYTRYQGLVPTAKNSVMAFSTETKTDTLAVKQLTLDEQLTKLNKTTSGILVTLWLMIAASITAVVVMSNSVK